jgi:bacterioferritin
LCAEAGDNASRDLFVKLLHDEEGHVDWLETQLGLIEKLGLDNYLAQQM